MGFGEDEFNGFLKHKIFEWNDWLRSSDFANYSGKRFFFHQES